MAARFDVITLFPEIFTAVKDFGITSRAMKRGLWNVHFWNPRDVTTDVHRTVDDRPFGGGPGMVMMAEPLYQTLQCIRASGNNGRVLAFAPSAAHLTDARVREFSTCDDLQRVPVVLLTGHHANIVAWRREKSLEATLENRPELIETARQQGLLTKRDEKTLLMLSSKN